MKVLTRAFLTIAGAFCIVVFVGGVGIFLIQMIISLLPLFFFIGLALLLIFMFDR